MCTWRAASAALLFISLFLLDGASAAAGSNEQEPADISRSVAEESARRIVRICTYDLAGYEQSASEPIPSAVDNVRTRTAQENQRALITKVKGICESKPYWLKKIIDWGNGGATAQEDAFVAKQVAYALELQVRYLREAKKTYVRVMEEEADRLNRSGQLQEIFAIRSRLRKAQKQAATEAEAAASAPDEEEIAALISAASSGGAPPDASEPPEDSEATDAPAADAEREGANGDLASQDGGPPIGGSSVSAERNNDSTPAAAGTEARINENGYIPAGNGPV